MRLGPWVRTALWHQRGWRAVLATLAGELRATPPSPVLGERAIELAQALELIEPDRTRAVEMYVLAWNATKLHPQSLARARQLCRGLRALPQVARLARAEHEQTGDTDLLTVEAIAWLDAGDLEHARQALAAAVRARPRDEQLRATLAAAIGQVADPDAEIARWVEHATEAPPAQAATAFAHAARLARLLGAGEATYMRLVRDALQRNAADDDVFGLAEEILLGRGDADDLLRLYRGRLQAAPDTATWVEDVRAASTKLILGGAHAGLGLRLLQRGLAQAYDTGMTEIPGHLASWSLLVDHARRANLLHEAAGLLVRGLELPLTDIDRLWLSMTGLEIAWCDARDVAAARGYAGVLAEIAPEHPMLHEFVSSAGMGSGVASNDPTASGGRRAASSSSHPTASSGAHPTGKQPAISGSHPTGKQPATNGSHPTGTQPATSGSHPTGKQPAISGSHPTAASASQRTGAAPSGSGRAAPPQPPRPPAAPAPEPEPELSLVYLDEHKSRSVDAANAWQPGANRQSLSEMATSSADRTAAAVIAGGSEIREPAPPPPGAAGASRSATHSVVTASARAADSAVSRPPLRPGPTAGGAAGSPPGELIPQSAASALRRVSTGKLVVPARPPLPANARARAHRVILPVDCGLTLGAGGVNVPAVTRDISTTGMFILTTAELDLGTVLTIEVRLPGDDELDVVTYQVTARAVRQAEGIGYGVVFIDPPADLVRRVSVMAESAPER